MRTHTGPARRGTPAAAGLRVLLALLGVTAAVWLAGAFLAAPAEAADLGDTVGDLTGAVTAPLAPPPASRPAPQPAAQPEASPGRDRLPLDATGTARAVVEQVVEPVVRRVAPAAPAADTVAGVVAAPVARTETTSTPAAPAPAPAPAEPAAPAATTPAPVPAPGPGPATTPTAPAGVLEPLAAAVGGVGATAADEVSQLTTALLGERGVLSGLTSTLSATLSSTTSTLAGVVSHTVATVEPTGSAVGSVLDLAPAELLAPIAEAVHTSAPGGDLAGLAPSASVSTSRDVTATTTGDSDVAPSTVTPDSGGEGAQADGHDSPRAPSPTPDGAVAPAGGGSAAAGQPCCALTTWAAPRTIDPLQIDGADDAPPASRATRPGCTPD